MPPNTSFNLPFRPGKKPVAKPVAAGQHTLCFRPKPSSTNAAVAKTSHTKSRKGEDAAKKALKRVLETALEDTSALPVDNVDVTSRPDSEREHDSEVASSQQALDPPVPQADKGVDASERAYQEAFQDIEWDELVEKNTLKRERADAKKQKIKHVAEAEKARNSLAKAKHNEDEMLSMLSGFKVNRKPSALRKATGTGISKASRFKTPTIDYAKIQRQGKALVKATQDKILPASDFWRESLESQKDKNAHIENAVKNATFLQPSRIRVHSYAAWSRARTTGDTNEDGTPKLLR
ncbi:hypothetical protein AC578_918 [Pseudocercospora eumusae]|uniref:Uncharacterized protein n=1 Tax=Pseudocercospora eumusae TaxID=321146 RepID=A0A139HBU5_9PEZI|nr:hypothetical protein AC578_918 [Pseudocercospora eumusae]